MNGSLNIPKLFTNRFTVDYSAPFRRHLNRLEVEIGREDYRHLKRVELLAESPTDEEFNAMEEITSRLLETTQNNYNRDLLLHLGIRVYLDVPRYTVYYRLPEKTLRFIAAWRQQVLRRFFSTVPTEDTGWRSGAPRLADFEVRFLPDLAGGILLLRRIDQGKPAQPLLTATHGPYDPHSLDVTLYFLRTGRGDAALINLGFSGREPLTDENLEKLKSWGIPLNPSNIDVIYPYVDGGGRPYCYKLEEGLGRYVAILDRPPPKLIIDIHGCVGTRPDDSRLVLGLGGFPPYPSVSAVGKLKKRGDALCLSPLPPLRHGLDLLNDLSKEICVQFCDDADHGFHFAVTGGMQLVGRALTPSAEVKSLLPGEERTYLPGEDIRWLPGAGGNAIQRQEARKLRADAICLHVEIPTAIRRRIALKLRELEITDSLDASAL